ncbi:hypothetical protein BpHYR1_025264, partial [Brachionus plicatilis]
MSQNRKGRSNIDLNVIVDKSVQFLIENALTPCELVGSYSGENTLWGRLCLFIFGAYVLKDSLFLHTMWKRDTKKYKTNGMNKFKQIRLEKEQKIIRFSEKDKK